MRALLIMMFAAGGLSAAEWDFNGSVGVELRGYPDAPAYSGQLNGIEHSLEFDPELRITALDGLLQFQLEPHVRLADQDGERNHFELGTASATVLVGGWEVLAGVDRVFWGVAESRHLVDIVNQTDLVEDLDQEDKLGQTMISLARQTDWGLFSFLVLPDFEERTFPGVEGRLRTPLPVESENPSYESSAGSDHIDLALRYAHFVGDWDIGAHLFHGTDREPSLRPNSEGNALQPHYALISQFGVDVQYTRDAWLWKLEAIQRTGAGNSFSAVVGGFEYTLFQVAGGDADLGLLVELLYDGRSNDAPATPFDRDLFVGARWAWNDVQDTSLLAGLITDTNDGSRLFSIEGERRVGDNWKIEVEGRWFVDVAEDNTLNVFRQDSYLTARLTRYF